MLLLVSGRHVGAHLGGHQHGVSIQISINLGGKFLHISSIRKIAMTWILARVFAYLLSFFSQILDLIYEKIFIFILIYFWMACHRKPAIWGSCRLLVTGYWSEEEGIQPRDCVYKRTKQIKIVDGTIKSTKFKRKNRNFVPEMQKLNVRQKFILCSLLRMRLFLCTLRFLSIRE